jgi:integrase
MGKLTARKVETAKPGKYGDGGGLQLSVAPSGARKWVYRYQRDGRAHEMGLGSFPVVGLSEAREKALLARRLARSGKDPIEDRKRDRGVPTFGEIADEVVASLGAGFRNEKHRYQWVMTLSQYAAPLRPKPVDEITTEDVLAVLKPLWQRAPETASRLRGRIERVLSAAKAKGHRTGENPAAWRGHLDALLPRRQKLARPHHEALPYSEVPAFMGRLREHEDVASRALEFAILCAARSGEVRGMLWSEVDLETKVWNIPAARMKSGRPHSVPLSDRALAIVEEMDTRGEFVFAGSRGRALGPSALERALKRMNVEAATHGFRSSFRDWAGNETHHPRDVAEMALAHVVGNAAEQAYRRGDALEKRRALMSAWAAYCEPSSAEEKVTPLRRKA